MKILLIDDSVLDRKLVSRTISKAGIENEVLEACDGEEGLEILSKNYEDICLVLLDWQMPKMDGIEFMKAVVSVPQVASVPIIMITASGSQESKDIVYGINPNLAGYLVKPYSSEMIISMIRPFVK